MKHDLKTLFSIFRTEGTYLKGEPFGSGHIHETYHITTKETDKDDYILQKLNNKVFRNIPELQDNIERVTAHLQNKIAAIPGSDIRRECLILVPSVEGKSWIVDNSGNFWRSFVFIRDHHTYDIVDSQEKAYEGGRAIGRFQALLADLPGKKLHDTIPFFHDVEKRIDNFIKSVERNPAGRKHETNSEIDAILERSENMRIIHKFGREGKIPVRITHNDTKFNNILFDADGRSLCIIDLDTVMSGYFHSDFGDAIRTGANTGVEDEVDLSKIRMNISLFEAYAKGYLSETKNTLNDLEKEYLAFAPLLMTYEQTLRFLTDYLDGDTYYKIHHVQHNLQRTRAQLRLLESMEQQYGEMQGIISKLV